MPHLSDTILRLRSFRAAAAKNMMNSVPPGADRLTDLRDFGANPGELAARLYRPRGLPAGAPLVVVLHGCTQTAVGYDHGSGWTKLADTLGFAVLFPEQRRGNNPNLCFNWFNPGDIARGQGEAASIKSMIDKVLALHKLDKARVYVTGLSAGGAMAAALLAAYPDVFAAGAVIAGVPFGVATTVPQAFERMRGQGLPDAAVLASLARGASSHAGPAPAVQIWHGEADATVSPANADALLAQWRGAHNLPARHSRTQTQGTARRRQWLDETGRVAVEDIRIPGMGHGTPIAPGARTELADDGLGAAMPFMLDVGVSSTEEIARFFGLTQAGRIAAPAMAAASPAAKAAKALAPVKPSRIDILPPPRAEMFTPQIEVKITPPHGNLGPYIKHVIEDALRKAGLMR